MTDMKSLVLLEFQKSFQNARNKNMSDLAPSAIGDHPLLLDTLRAIDGKTSSVDDASAALSRRADELEALAASCRTSPEWGDICVAMGAVRNAAVAVWRG
ncbi:hypothetical protein O9X98_06290 [Agrobacterium salinitolerans]|nr:hypothetical protein [Agrobacterium salinitolerans]